MDPVKRQYETYPYPARDPADEAHRLIEGSPSHPVEIDHYLFQGQRDWSRPFRVLVAGGGTGDGLIMLAQKLADISCPAEITYIDMSEASRAIAEARAAARGLTIRFITGDLMTAADDGPFDYIDCCGVLHHLPDPEAGLQALSDALSPDGGIGLMVYAPYGRSGVYPLQEAFATLCSGDDPADRVAFARAALDRLPEAHAFRRNQVLGDHRDSDAGLYDLLLHARDRAYRVPELLAVLDAAGLGPVSFVEAARYDPACYLPPGASTSARLKGLEAPRRWTVAEQLSGTMKTHIVYAVPLARAATAMARPTRAGARPHLSGVAPDALARQVANKGRISATIDTTGFTFEIPRAAAPLIGAINGRRTLGEIAGAVDWLAFSQTWSPVHRALTGLNLLHYSDGARR